jgi:hypothetical protein
VRSDKKWDRPGLLYCRPRPSARTSASARRTRAAVRSVVRACCPSDHRRPMGRRRPSLNPDSETLRRPLFWSVRCIASVSAVRSRLSDPARPVEPVRCTPADPDRPLQCVRSSPKRADGKSDGTADGITDQRSPLVRGQGVRCPTASSPDGTIKHEGFVLVSSFELTSCQGLWATFWYPLLDHYRV